MTLTSNCGAGHARHNNLKKEESPHRFNLLQRLSQATSITGMTTNDGAAVLSLTRSILNFDVVVIAWLLKLNHEENKNSCK